MNWPVFTTEWIASWKLVTRNLCSNFVLSLFLAILVLFVVQYDWKWILLLVPVASLLFFILREPAFYFIKCNILDILFFISFGFLTAPVFDKLTEHVIIIGSLVSAQMQAAAGRARPAIIDALFQEPVRGYVWQFFGLLIVLAAAVFVLFWLFQGTAWWLAHGIAGKKHRWRPFLLSFGKVASVWFGLYVVWYAVDAVLDLRRLLLEKATGQPALAANVIMLVILALIVYFALLSCVLLNVRKSFSIGISKVLLFLPAIILVLAHFLAGNFIVRLLGVLHSSVMFVGGVVLLVALLSWTRVYIVRVVLRA